MEEFLNSLGIHKEGNYSRDGVYVIDLDSDEDFGRIYTILDRNEDVEELTENQLITVDEASVSYASDDYLLTLTGDFNSGIYRLTCTEL